MSKLKNPLLSLQASGTLARILTFVRRGKVDLVEKKPEILDTQSAPQLGWRHMFNKCVDLWHLLSAAEKAEWESAARSRHMTGYAWYMSQCLRPNPGIYLPLQGGTMSGDIDMAKHRILKLPAPTDSQEAANKAYADAPGTTQTKGARVYHNVDQEIPDATLTALAFNSERYDTDSIHDPVAFNSRLTCKTAGKYLIIVHIRWEHGTGGYRRLDILLNALTTICDDGEDRDGLIETRQICATIWNLAVNDYVEARVYHTEGAPLDVDYRTSYSPEFMMQRIG